MIAKAPRQRDVLRPVRPTRLSPPIDFHSSGPSDPITMSNDSRYSVRSTDRLTSIMAQYHVIASVTIDEFVYNVGKHGRTTGCDARQSLCFGPSGILFETDSISAALTAMARLIYITPLTDVPISVSLLRAVRKTKCIIYTGCFEKKTRKL